MEHHAAHPRRIRLPRAPWIAAAAALLTACAGSLGTSASGPTTGTTVAQAVASTVSGDTLTYPRNVYSNNGLLDVQLAVEWADLAVPITADSSVTWRLRAYSVQEIDGVPTSDSTPAYPGPTFHVKPGDSVRILLINNLTPSDNETCQPQNGPSITDTIDHYPDCFHGPTWTNIHYHGFHVTPDSLGDDVLLQIAPGDSFQYAFGIPLNQSTGTHWYHPHKHGSVAVQVLNGMAGAFLIQGGPLDVLADSLNMKDVLIGVQQLDTTVNLITTNNVTPNLVNGQYRPTLVMRQNEVQRWRIVNEDVKPQKLAQVGFVDAANVNEPSMYDVARDGVQYAPVNYSTSSPDTLLLVAPGNRLDVFVQAPSTVGLHTFNIKPVGAERPRQRLRGATLAATATAPADTLFYVQVLPADDSGYNTTLPTTLPALPSFLANLDQQSQMAVIVFTDTTAQAPTRFYLGSEHNPYQQFRNDTVFIPSDSARLAMPMLLNRTQTWKIINRSEQKINHPFHIHINPFQVDSVYAPLSTDPFQPLYAQLNTASSTSVNSPIWLDVLPLPAPVVTGGVITTESFVIITQKYADYTGQYVMHCHILGHEERGMMQLLEVFPNRIYESASGGDGGHRH